MSRAEANARQVEHHPYCVHLPLLTRSRDLADDLGIPTAGYSTLVSLYIFRNGPIDGIVRDLAKKRGLTEAQVGLLWAAQTTSGTISA